MSVLNSSFAPISRAGFVAGRTKAQVAVVLVATAVAVVPLAFGVSIWSWRVVVCLVVAVFGAWNVHGRSLIGLLAVKLGFGMRKATGKTHWTVSPWAVNQVVGVIDLPDATGKRLRTFDIVGTEFDSAAFLWDKDNSEATAILQLHALDWLFQSDGVREGRVTGWSQALKSCADMPDVSRIVTQARVFYQLNNFGLNAEGNDFVLQDLAEAASDMRISCGHDVIVSITIDTSKTRGDSMKDTGTVAGVSRILSDRVQSLVSLLEYSGADLDDVRWLDAQQLRGQMKCMFSPEAISLLDEYGGLPDDVALSTSWDEYRDYMHVDAMYLRTMWVDKWPSDPVPAGWLHDLVSNGRWPLVLTQVWHPLPLEKAEHKLNNQLMELERRDKINKKLGRPTSERDRSEALETVNRRKELAKGYGDVEYLGYVTVGAPTLDLLEQATNWVDSEFRQRSAHLDRLRASQWSGLITALPLGQAGRK